MSDKNESMNGIIKLYDLRRESVMREGRNWFAAFYADSFQDIENVFKGGDDVFFRMVLTYWEMAATFVNQGVIDEQMFNESNAEHIFAYAKIAPFVEELRVMAKAPYLLANLEKLILRIPNVQETMANIREQAKAKQTAREKTATA